MGYNDNMNVLALVSFLFLILFASLTNAEPNQCLANLRGQIGIMDLTQFNGELGQIDFDQALGQSIGGHIINGIEIPETQYFSSNNQSRAQTVSSLRESGRRVGVLLDMHISPVFDEDRGYGVKLTLNGQMLSMQDGRVLGGHILRANYFNLGASCEKAMKEHFNLRTREQVPDCLSRILSRSDSEFHLRQPATRNPASELGLVLREQLNGYCKPSEPSPDSPSSGSGVHSRH